jgi:hypothetical protein
MVGEPAHGQRKALLASIDRIAQGIERQEALMRELSLWARLGAAEEARTFFEKTLSSDKKKWVYEAHDGDATQGMIEEQTLVPQRTVSNWAQRWEDLGILIDLGGGRRRKVVALSALDLEVPPLPNRKS